MDTSLRKYLVTLDDWLGADICQQAVSSLQSANWRAHQYGDGDSLVALDTPSDQALQVFDCEDRKLGRAIMEKVAAATRLYVAVQRMPWLAAPRNHSLVRFNRYGPGAVMQEHCDHISSLFDGSNRGIPILTVLMQLNDDFDGGELVFFGQEVVQMKAGTAIVFPSNFLYPHRVEPVTGGARYSCVSWAW